MARTRRISTTTATAAVIWAASAGLTVTTCTRRAPAQVAPPASAPAAPAAAAAPDLSPAERSAAEVRALAETLEAPGNDPAPRRYSRDEAARRLALRGADGGGDEVLARVIRSGDGKEAKVAALRGIACRASPPPDLVQPIAALLPDRSPGVNEAAADALAAYKDDPRVIESLANFARDANQSPLLRVNTIHALGRIPDPRCAAVLVGLLGDKTTSVRNAAGEALAELTGRHDLGPDRADWVRWQKQNADKPAAQWKAEVLNFRAAVDDELRRRNQELVAELSSRLSQELNAATPQQRPVLLLDMLRSGVADVRAIGADLVGKGFVRGTLAPTPEIRDRLIDAVGDSSRDARLQAAKTLYLLNEFAAYDALLAQLPVEPDEDVRAEQLHLLGRLEVHPGNSRVRSVALVRRLLNDPSLLVQKAAADAIAQFGPALVRQDPTLADRLAQDLAAVIRRTGNDPDAVELRNSGIVALGALRSRLLLDLAPALLDRRESVRTRIATLRALGDLGDPNGADRIAGWMPKENDKGVRLEALTALGRISRLERVDMFLMYMDPRQEPDESIRAGARDVILSLLPGATEQQLTRVAQAFRNDREMHIAILKALSARLEQRGETESLAMKRQDIGVDLLESGKPGEAVPFLQQAIDYYEKQNAAGLTMESLIGQLTTALLQSRQYQQAAEFATRTLARDRSQMATFGRMLTQEADRLKEANKADDAIALVDAALKMNPPLDNRYVGLLKEVRAQAEQRRPKAPASTRPATQPQPAPPPAQ